MTDSRVAPAPQKRIRKARGHGHERPREILDVAKTLFAAEGHENVTTRRIAEQVGMSQAALYVYFANKEEIVDALRRETHLAIMALIDDIAAEMPPSLDLLRAIGRAYLQFAAEHPQEYQIALLAGNKRRPQAPDPRDLDRPFAQQPAGRQCFLTFRREIARLIDAGVLAPGDPTLVAQTIWMALQGMAGMLITFPNFPWHDRERLTEAMIGMIAEGVAARPR